MRLLGMQLHAGRTMLLGPPMCCWAPVDSCSIVCAMKGWGAGIAGMWAPVQTPPELLQLWHRCIFCKYSLSFTAYKYLHIRLFRSAARELGKNHGSSATDAVYDGLFAFPGLVRCFSSVENCCLSGFFRASLSSCFLEPHGFQCPGTSWGLLTRDGLKALCLMQILQSEAVSVWGEVTAPG